MALERTQTAVDFVIFRFSRLHSSNWAAVLLTSSVVYTIGLPAQRVTGTELLLNMSTLQQCAPLTVSDGDTCLVCQKPAA
jgi:hypothetical protein